MHNESLESTAKPIGLTQESLPTFDTLPEGNRTQANTPMFQVWMPSSAGSPAKMLALQGEARVSIKARALVFGTSSLDLLAKYDHESCCLKMYQPLLPMAGWPLLNRLPRWGMMRNGALYQQKMPALPTFDNDGFALLYPTPVASDTSCRQLRDSEASIKGRTVRRLRNGIDRSARLSEVLRWATPAASDYKRIYNESHIQSRSQKCLTEQAASATHKYINPEWEEVLMGYPMGWTDAS